jgi:hypothetical protein
MLTILSRFSDGAWQRIDNVTLGKYDVGMYVGEACQ